MTKKWEEKDCDKCEHVEKDPREEPCLHCGILQNGFEEPPEKEYWNSMHGQIVAPKGAFDAIYNDEDG